MSISGISCQNKISCYTDSQQVKNENSDFTSTITAVASKNKTNDKILGLTMIKDNDANIFYGMKATYAPESTPGNPIIQIDSNYGGKKSTYKIPINDINPDNASRLEMFALCSYADDQGVGDKSKFGTFQTLKGFEDMSIHNGFLGEGIKEATTFEEFRNYKLNWVNACKKTVDLLYKCNDLIQYNKGKDILNLFEMTKIKCSGN